MNRILIILGCAVTFSLFGCQQGDLLQPSEIKCYGTDPLYHTVYIGSDALYHHFAWSKGKVSGQWKVEKSAITLKETFPIDSGKSRFVTRDDSGKVDLIIFEKETEPVK